MMHAAIAVVVIAACVFVSGCTPRSIQDGRMHTQSAALAFIDTSISPSTELALDNLLWTNQGEVSNDGIDNDGNGYVDDCHGWNFVNDDSAIQHHENDEEYTTHADLIAHSFLESYSYIDENTTRVMMLCALRDDNGPTSIDRVLKAIDYAEDNGASICNLSLSSYQDIPKLKERLAASSMLFIVAAGNDGENLDAGFPSYPTLYGLSNVLSVAATDEDGRLLDSSNYGPTTVDISVCGIVGSGNQGQGEGTSVAAAKVSALALMLHLQSKSPKGPVLKRAVMDLANGDESVKKTTIAGYVDVTANTVFQ